MSTFLQSVRRFKRNTVKNHYIALISRRFTRPLLNDSQISVKTSSKDTDCLYWLREQRLKKRLFTLYSMSLFSQTLSAESTLKKKQNGRNNNNSHSFCTEAWISMVFATAMLKAQEQGLAWTSRTIQKSCSGDSSRGTKSASNRSKNSENRTNNIWKERKNGISFRGNAP